MYTYHNRTGNKCLRRLRLLFSHLRYKKFKHGFFLYAFDPLCNCTPAIENTFHHFLHCVNFFRAQNTFLNKISRLADHLFSVMKTKFQNFPF